MKSAAVTELLSVADTHPACEVLGPGIRYGVWVQGCSMRCVGCTSPQWLPFEGGRQVPVRELAADIADQAIDGLTISGGEPFDHAPALANLVTRVRRLRDLSVMSFTGYTVDHLRRHGSAAQRDLLALLDILVDGPFIASAQQHLLWRGSRNQRLHFLTDRHTPPVDDRSAGLQFEVTADLEVHWLGVPPVAGFRTRFEELVSREGYARVQPNE